MPKMKREPHVWVKKRHVRVCRFCGCIEDRPWRNTDEACSGRSPSPEATAQLIADAGIIVDPSGVTVVRKKSKQKHPKKSWNSKGKKD